jgi:CBS domain-containing protein
MGAARDEFRRRPLSHRTGPVILRLLGRAAAYPPLGRCTVHCGDLETLLSRPLNRTCSRPDWPRACMEGCPAPTTMTILTHILNSKPDHTVYTITPTASVFDAVKLMAEKSIGALVVTEGERVAGILTERDYARKIVLMARSSKETAVRDIMTTSVMYVRPDQTSEECMALMTQHRLRHLPVLDNGKLIGLISIGDLVKDIISEQKFIIQQLEHYISGEHG